MRVLMLLMILAAGCTHYPDDCNRRALQQLRTVDRLIEQTRLNLARGYTYEVVDRGYRTGIVLCTGGNPVNVCTSSDTGYTRRPVAIDPEAEQRKLQSLLSRREALAEATATCTPV